MRKPWDYEEPSCAEVGVEIFFNKDKDEALPGISQTAMYTEARKICETCPHKMECAEWGIYNETHGVWGGLTPNDRSKLRKRLNIVVAPRENIIL